MNRNPHGLHICTAMVTKRVNDIDLEQRRELREKALAAAKDAPPRPGWLWSKLKGWRETNQT